MRVRVARVECGDLPDVDPWLVDRAIGKQYRARETDAARGTPERAHRERMVRRIDATEGDGGEVEHGGLTPARARGSQTDAGWAAGACEDAAPAVSSRQRSAPRTTTSGARCSVARLSVVNSSIQPDALVNQVTN